MPRRSAGWWTPCSPPPRVKSGSEPRRGRLKSPRCIDTSGAHLGGSPSLACCQLSSAHLGRGYQLGQFFLSIAVGVAGAAIGVALLWFCLRWLGLGEVLGTASQLACVVAVTAACDIVVTTPG